MVTTTALRKQIKKVAKEESGLVAVEFVICLPLILALGILLVDATSAFMTQATMWRNANDVTRGLATGRLTPAEAERLVTGTFGYAFQATRTDDVIRVDLSAPFSRIGSGTMLSALGDLRVTLHQRAEPHVQSWN